MKIENYIILTQNLQEFLVEVLLSIRHYNDDKKVIPEHIQISQCMLQQVIIKLGSISSLSKGVKLFPNSNLYVDTLSIFPIVRSIYEGLFIHHCLMIMSGTDEKRNLLINIWKCKRYIYTANIPLVDFGDISKESLKKGVTHQNDDNNSIQKIKMEIELNPLYEKYKDKISNSLKNAKIRPLIFEESDQKCDLKAIEYRDGWKYLFPNNKVMSTVYSYLSTNTHPSFFSLKIRLKKGI